MKYVAILRGINVGGNRKLLMADLKQMFLTLGFKDVQTYIQSGNVIFTNPQQLPQKEISAIIEQTIKTQFGYDVPVLVLTKNELEQVAKESPYSEEDIKLLYFTFLKEAPSKILAEDDEFAPDKFQIIGKTVHIRYNEKISKSKLTNNLIENRLKITATTRNWKTVHKLIVLCQ